MLELMSDTDAYTDEELEVSDPTVRIAISSARITLEKKILRLQAANVLLAIFLVVVSLLFVRHVKEQVIAANGFAQSMELMTGIVSKITNIVSKLGNRVGKLEENTCDGVVTPLISTPTVKVAVKTPAPTSTRAFAVAISPDQTSAPDRWSEVLDSGCEITAVYFRVADGVINDDSQRLWTTTTGRYEIWAALVFGTNPDKYQKDMWGNPTAYRIIGEVESLEAMRLQMETIRARPARVLGTVRGQANVVIGEDYLGGVIHSNTSCKASTPTPTAMPTQTPTFVAPTVTPAATPVTPIVTATTSIPPYSYISVDVDPHAWEVSFPGGYVENVTTRRHTNDGSYYQGRLYVVATCSYSDLEAIKKILNDRALDNEIVRFELVDRWNRWFLTSINGRAWKVCPEWYNAEDGRGF